MLYEKIQLEKDEQVLLVLRRHWFLLAADALRIVSGALLPFVAVGVALSLESTRETVEALIMGHERLLWFFGALWILVSWMLLGARWTDWYLDVWIVTDRRIIAIDQRALFVREVGSFRLERLQDINILIPGILATLFDFGTIELQTASEDTFSAHGIPRPRTVKAAILKAVDERMHVSQEGQSAGV